MQTFPLPVRPETGRRKRPAGRGVRPASPASADAPLLAHGLVQPVRAAHFGLLVAATLEQGDQGGWRFSCSDPLGTPTWRASGKHLLSGPTRKAGCSVAPGGRGSAQTRDPGRGARSRCRPRVSIPLRLSRLRFPRLNVAAQTPRGRPVPRCPVLLCVRSEAQDAPRGLCVREAGARAFEDDRAPRWRAAAWATRAF